MTNDELLNLRREAKRHGQLLEAAGLNKSRIFTLINSDLPIIIDQLIRSNNELETKDTNAAKSDVIGALENAGIFPNEWIAKHFGVE